jgi:hypothetical protein
MPVHSETLEHTKIKNSLNMSCYVLRLYVNNTCQLSLININC